MKALNILDEIKPIILSTDKSGELIEDFTDEFRDGRNPWSLLDLINSDDVHVNEVGLYVLNEMIIEERELIEKLETSLSKLTTSKDSNIRFRSFLILSQIFTDSGENEKETNLYLAMYKDENEHIKAAGEKLLRDGHLR